MSTPKSPFAASSAIPGNGNIQLSLLPPDNQVLTSFIYQYPLKLIAPDPHRVKGKHVTVVFLLTYGGGLVGGDKVHLHAHLKENTRLVLVTQGSTKIFKSPSRAIVSSQTLDVKVDEGAALCYFPDPTQPFAESVYEQRQTFHVHPRGQSNVLLLDWVNEGRRARGESWTLWSWKGRNEIRELDGSSSGRLLLRDAVILNDDDLGGTSLSSKTEDMGVFGTLIIYGPMFQSLQDFFMTEFASQPRIGAKQWTQDAVNGGASPQALVDAAPDGLLWTAAHIRGPVVVKFGAKDLDGARRWLANLIKREGTVEREFGHQALICLR